MSDSDTGRSFAASAAAPARTGPAIDESEMAERMRVLEEVRREKQLERERLNQSREIVKPSSSFGRGEEASGSGSKPEVQVSSRLPCWNALRDGDAATCPRSFDGAVLRTPGFCRSGMVCRTRKRNVGWPC